MGQCNRPPANGILQDRGNRNRSHTMAAGIPQRGLTVFPEMSRLRNPKAVRNIQHPPYRLVSGTSHEAQCLAFPVPQGLGMPGAMAMASIRPVSQMATAAVQLRFWPKVDNQQSAGRWPAQLREPLASLKSSTVSRYLGFVGSWARSDGRRGTGL